MKMSVVSDSSGKIVAASFTPPEMAQRLPSVADAIKIPEGHRVDELALPADLVSELLTGNFAQAFARYTVELKGTEATLRPTSAMT
jgi:hypothetical protein